MTQYDLSRIPERVRSKFVVTDDHWEWTAAKTKGYGYVQWDGRVQKATRVIWELLVGPIPDSLHLDHLCRYHPCVNPDHLEPVTNAENARRGEAGLKTGARQRAKTHCPQGHAYDERNTYRDKRGHRLCIACLRANTRRYRTTAKTA